MKWTKKRPTKAGWYWWRDEQELQIPRKVYFVRYTNNWCVMDGSYNKVLHLEDLDGEWSDEPIPVPKEDKE